MKIALSLLCLLTAVLTLLTMTACGTSEEGSATRDEASDAPSGWYQIEDYQSDEVFDIEEVSLNGDDMKEVPESFIGCTPEEDPVRFIHPNRYGLL